MLTTNLRRRLVGVALPAALAALLIAASQPNRNYTAHCTGGEEVPARDTGAQGQAVFRRSQDGASLSYHLNVANIHNVVAAHIHLGAAGTNGPVVAFLYGPAAPGGGRIQGRIAAGSIASEDLLGPLVGKPLSALMAAMDEGSTYVNVHTNDGVAPPNEGPGDFPGGEIRGQIR